MSDDYDANFVVVTPQELHRLRASADESLAAAKRIQADFVNYQDRSKSDLASARKYAVEKLLEELLPILDAVDTCLEHVRDPDVSSGVGIIQKEIWRVLTKWGIRRIEAKGMPFDPTLHRAAAVEETTGSPDGAVLEELKAGYRLHDRVLRPALVKVAKKPAASADSPNAPAP